MFYFSSAIVKFWELLGENYAMLKPNIPDNYPLNIDILLSVEYDLPLDETSFKWNFNSK